MTPDADQTLSQTAICADERDYRLVSLPANAITLAAAILAEAGLPFSALICDKDETTLVLQDAVLPAFRARLRVANISDQRYRLISFSAILEPDLVGFIARISQALAAAEIPVLAFAAFSRDHVFVPADALSKAVAVLQTLQDDLRQGQ